MLHDLSRYYTNTNIAANQQYNWHVVKRVVGQIAPSDLSKDRAKLKNTNTIQTIP